MRPLGDTLCSPRGGKFHERETVYSGSSSSSPSSSSRQSFSANSIKSPSPPSPSSSRERYRGERFRRDFTIDGSAEARTMPAMGANARPRQSANTLREPFLYARSCARLTKPLSIIYNDSFRWLVTRVRRINWSCYSVAARRDPNRARSRVQPFEVCEQRGLQKRLLSFTGSQ